MILPAAREKVSIPYQVSVEQNLPDAPRRVIQRRTARKAMIPSLVTLKQRFGLPPRASLDATIFQVRKPLRSSRASAEYNAPRDRFRPDVSSNAALISGPCASSVCGATRQSAKGVLAKLLG